VRSWLPWFLVLLGLGQMAADVANVPIVSALFFATAASPAPKVFTALSGLEPFSSRFALETVRGGMITETTTVTSELYQRLSGPYNRRNVFGAILAGGAVLKQSPWTAPMVDAVLNYGLCGERPPLVEELGLPQGDGYRLRIIPKHKVAFPLILVPSCSH
jgi:hypothetical protein